MSWEYSLKFIGLTFFGQKYFWNRKTPPPSSIGAGWSLRVLIHMGLSCKCLESRSIYSIYILLIGLQHIDGIILHLVYIYIYIYIASGIYIYVYITGWWLSRAYVYVYCIYIHISMYNMDNTCIYYWLVVEPSLWKMMEFVSWDDEIPNWMEK